MSEEEINNLKADLEADGNEDALTYLKGIRDEIVIDDEPEHVIEVENNVELDPAVVQEPVVEEPQPIEIETPDVCSG
mgnify:CR=1 FL=1